MSFFEEFKKQLGIEMRKSMQPKIASILEEMYGEVLPLSKWDDEAKRFLDIMRDRARAERNKKG